MTTLSRAAGRAPDSDTHRPAVGARLTRPGGRTAIAVVARLLDAPLGRELVTFGAIGIVSTAAYAVLYLALRSVTGAAVANALALLLTAVGNTAANRRLTFGVRDRGAMVRDQVGGLAALAVALVITTAAVNVLDAVAPHAGRLLELSVLVIANALATVARFVLLRSWIAADRRAAPVSTPSEPTPQE